jgi:apolipoprotein N-acyltransferase
MQLASIGGIYLLSFFVIFTNITAYKMFTKIKYVKLPSLALPTCLPFISLAIFPYLFGICHQTIQQYIHEQPKILKTALLQTALYPEEHSFMPQYDEKKFIPPHMQWQKILTLLKNQITNTVDLIVMPESTVPLLYNQEFLPTDYAIFMLQNTFKENAIKYLPTHASSSISNAFFSQFIANYFNADVVIGMDKDNYNAALIFHPQNGPIESYEKRILVPIGEYIPFNWLKNIVKNFGITGSYAHGHANKIFKGKKANFSVSICYEETFGYMIKQNNADLLINISNDAWFPNSHLPQQHFDHGKIRILENGTPLIRACNIGITGGIDAFGKTIKILSKDANKSGLLILDVPLHHYKTLYSFWGDYFIMLFSCSFVLVFYTIKLAQLKKNKNIIPIDTMH